MQIKNVVKNPDYGKSEGIVLILVGIMTTLRLLAYMTIGSGYMIDMLLIFNIIFALMFYTSRVKRKRTGKQEHRIQKIFLTLFTLLVAGFGWDTLIGLRDGFTIIQETEHNKVYTFDLTEEGRRYFVDKSEDILEKEWIDAYIIAGGKIVKEQKINVETSEIFNVEK